MIRDPWLKALVIVMVVIASLYLLSLLWQALLQFSEVVLLFFLAWLLAFMLEPLVSALYRSTPLSRPVAVTLTYLWLLVVLSAAVVLLVPVLAEQITQMTNQLPTFIEAVGVQLRILEANLAARGIEVHLAASLDYPELARRAETLGLQLLSNALGLATGVATLLLQVGLVVIISFYIMLDGERISANLRAAVPARIRGDVEYFLSSVNTAFTGFLRGQLFQGLMTGGGTAAIMLLVGLDYVVLASLVSGTVMMIPFIGPPLALIPPLAIAFFTKPEALWLTLVLLLVLQQVVVNIIAPRLVGSMVGLHPLLVFFAVIAGMKLAGPWGVIFGIPIMAVLVAMFTFYRTAIVESSRKLAREAATARRDAVDEPAASRPAERATGGGRPGGRSAA
jgi:predicted PurR-regulated permease PerM